MIANGVYVYFFEMFDFAVFIPLCFIIIAKIIDKNEYLSWYYPENVNENLTWKTNFHYIDIIGNIGAVKLRLECEEVGFIDYFNLMKIDGKWWIVHKLSHKIR